MTTSPIDNFKRSLGAATKAITFCCFGLCLTSQSASQSYGTELSSLFCTDTPRQDLITFDPSSQEMSEPPKDTKNVVNRLLDSAQFCSNLRFQIQSYASNDLVSSLSWADEMSVHLLTELTHQGVRSEDVYIKPSGISYPDSANPSAFDSQVPNRVQIITWMNE